MLSTLLWIILAIVIIGWLIGFTAHVAGGLIHILLVLAVIILLVNLFSGRRAVV